MTTNAALADLGRRIRYTGDMANPSGLGAIVRRDDTWADIALSDGRLIRAVAISHIVPVEQERGCLHRFLALDDCADELEQAELMAGCAIKAARDAAQATKAAEEFRATVEHLKATHPELKIGSGQTTAAANIRRMLRYSFSGVKFSVRQSGNSIWIRWSNGPRAEDVEKITNKFEDGHFDPMFDIYCYSSSPWNGTFGSARYIFTSRDQET